MSGISSWRVLEPRRPWHAGLQPMHWRILAASFMGSIFDC